MSELLPKNFIDNYADSIVSKGKLSFTLAECQKSLKIKLNPLYQAINRAIKRGSIVSIRNGFYAIVTPEYSIKGVPPFEAYIEDMMKAAAKKYYAGLLTAAAWHGASHQQSQVYQIVIKKPALRPLSVKGVKINFITREDLIEELIDEKKTAWGYLRISSPELTACDLIQFEKHSGGMPRVFEILGELSESMNVQRMRTLAKSDISITVFQRLGFLLDKLGKNKLAEPLNKKVLKIKPIKTPLSMMVKEKSGEYNERWRVIENVRVEEYQ